jgi:hypothetical protein
MSPVFDTFLANDSIVTTGVVGSPDGDLRLHPDLDRLGNGSDAYGVAEFSHLDAPASRQGLAELLQERADADELSLPDALRIAAWAGADNAHQVYRFSATS